MDELPHITWRTTGSLSFLPLHASGLYNHSQAKLSDFAISYYTPTLSVMLATHLVPSHANTGILGVSQEATSGQAPLPGTKEELTAIQKHIQTPLQCTQLNDQHATTAAVLAGMEKHTWVHLACHAHQNLEDPTESGFFLYDGTLTLKKIIENAFKKKGSAFLSACQTAKGDKTLPDEAVHLASGMLMAGYPSVIATMWSVVDEDAPVIADKVYGYLLRGGKLEHKDATKALHIAVNELRNKIGERAFERWVPYIHIGV